MPGLAFSEIDDAVLLTQEQLIKRGAFVDMQTDLTEHIAVREMWKGRTKQFAGGKDWEFHIQMDHNHSTRVVGLYESDGSADQDTMVEGAVDVRHINAHYIYDLRLPAFQRGGTEIVDFVYTKYAGMMVSLYEFLEEILWGKPVDDSDKKTPYGIGYWVTKNATEGFNGGNPIGFPNGRAGISTLDWERWANWTAGYASVTKDDLIRKMRRGHRMTQFRSPLSHAVPDLGGMRNGIYMGDTPIGLFEEAVEAQNMNLGNDIASKDGRTLFKGSPLTYAPYLNSQSDDPIYMLEWKFMTIGVLAGWENQLTAPYMVPGKHNVRRVDLDASMNMVCTDLRKQAVFTKTS